MVDTIVKSKSKKPKGKPRGNSNKVVQISHKAQELRKEDKYKDEKWTDLIKLAAKMV